MGPPRGTCCPPRVAQATESTSGWRNAASYAHLLGADRTIFAWEWLRRDPDYRAAACAIKCDDSAAPCGTPASFGLLAFEPPDRSAPDARPLWTAEHSPFVLAVERVCRGRAPDWFEPDRFPGLATLTESERGEHLLLSDGLRAVRLDGPPGVFTSGPAVLRYRLEGVAAAEQPLLTLRRFLALCRCGGFSRSLHAREQRARRWILMLRTLDGLRAGADQRELAQAMLGAEAAAPRWRTREPSMRSRVQRMVRSARAMAAGGYLALLR